MPFFLAAAASVGAGELFSYNRENFFFDQELRTKRIYQGQEMRVRQFELYREDIRDLVGLTVGKMENYLVVNTLQLGFCVAIFIEGRVEDEEKMTPWLVHLLMLCNVGAFLYYLLSIWLAMHASISAHSFGVRMLTQFCRLPVPNDQQLDDARMLASDYEGGRVRDIVRVPLWKQQLKNLNAVMTEMEHETASELDLEFYSELDEFDDGPHSPVATLQHIKLFRRLQVNWQSYDAYARVCMAMGTSQLLHALSYYCLGILITVHEVPWPAICCVVLFTTCGWVLARLDLYLSTRILATGATLSILPPVLVTSHMILESDLNELTVPDALLPSIYFLHVLWIVFLVCVARADNSHGVALPRKFRAVLYLDVFGWLSETDQVDNPSRGGAEGHRRDTDYGLPLSVVMEENRGDDALEMPAAVREMVVKECQQRARQLREDFVRWLSPEVASLLEVGEGESGLLQEVKRLRNRFEQIVAELSRDAVGSSQQENYAPNAHGSNFDEKVWLRLEYCPYDAPMEFFYCCETEQTLWEHPEGETRVSDPKELERFIDQLSELCEALASGRLATRARAQPEVQPAPPPSVILDQVLGEDDRVEVEEEIPFGGREAVRIDSGDGDASGDPFFSSTAAAGSTFHPATASTSAPADHPHAASGAPATTGGDSPSQDVRRRPGLLPWYTVLHGSYALIGVWVLGAVVSFSYPDRLWSEALMRSRPISALSPPPMLRVEQLTPVGNWSHPFVRPVGLLCDAAFGDTAIVAERYAIHAVPLAPGATRKPNSSEESSLLAVRDSLSHCLAENPILRGRGLAGVSVDCGAPQREKRSVCSALLLASDGRFAVNCSFAATTSPVADVTVDSSALSTSEKFKLPGASGGWRGLAPSASASPEQATFSASDRQQGGALWAAKAAAAVLLTPTMARGARALVPRMELLPPATGGTPANLTQLLAVEDSMLLGLGQDGLLHAWPLTGGPARSWSLPDQVQWGGGLCRVDRHLFFLGKAKQADDSFPVEGHDRLSTVGIWRAELPAPLRPSRPKATVAADVRAWLQSLRL